MSYSAAPHPLLTVVQLLVHKRLLLLLPSMPLLCHGLLILHQCTSCSRDDQSRLLHALLSLGDAQSPLSQPHTPPQKELQGFRGWLAVSGVLSWCPLCLCYN